jgi:hypothetical protein
MSKFMRLDPKVPATLGAVVGAVTRLSTWGEAKILEIVYEPDEARMWLLSRQKVLNGDIPAELIRQHRTDEVIKVIRELLEGVYV